MCRHSLKYQIAEYSTSADDNFISRDVVRYVYEKENINNEKGTKQRTARQNGVGYILEMIMCSLVDDKFRKLKPN